MRARLCWWDTRGNKNSPGQRSTTRPDGRANGARQHHEREGEVERVTEGIRGRMLQRGEQRESVRCQSLLGRKESKQLLGVRRAVLCFRVPEKRGHGGSSCRARPEGARVDGRRRPRAH